MKKLTVNEQLLKVPSYVPGKSAEEVQAEFGLTGVIKLASNENPMGPSPKAIEALTASLDQAHRYPGTAMREMRQALAEHLGHGLTEDHFAVGNGATDVIRMIAQAFLFDGGETVMATATFPIYGMMTALFGGRSVRIELTRDYGLDLAAIQKAVTDETRVVWLCSPNNPTGQVLSQKEVDGFVQRLDGRCLIVLDEAYCDYVTDDAAVHGLKYVQENRTVAVLRSFSKFAGLAGLRIGFAVARPDIVEILLHTMLPFSSGAAVIRGAIASLDDLEYQRAAKALVLSEREFLYESVTTLGMKCLPSQANFVMVLDVPGGGSEFADRLLHKGMIVRPTDDFGDAGAIRVSIGTRAQNERFLGALREVLAEFEMA